MKKVFRALITTARLAFGNRVEFCNVGEGFHKAGSVTTIADAPVPTLYLIATAGSDNAHSAICGPADVPRGIYQDILATGEAGHLLLLGKGPTKIAQGSGIIAANSLVIPDAGGQAKALPANGTGNGGTYWVIGESHTACAGNGEQFELNDRFPIQVTITS